MRMITVADLKYVANQLPPRFSPQFNPNHTAVRKTCYMAGNIFILGAGSISFLAFPQYTLVGFVAGAAMKDKVRHVIVTNWKIMKTVSLVCKAVLFLFAFVSWPYLYLGLPIFIGSFMAFHAISNRNGTKSYFSPSTNRGRTGLRLLRTRRPPPTRPIIRRSHSADDIGRMRT